MRIPSRSALVAGAATVLTLAVTAAPASAATLTNGASAYAAAAATGTAKVQPNLQLKGPLHAILDALISPTVTDDLNPLVAALKGGANTAVTAGLGSASSYNAGTTAGQSQFGTAPLAFPNDTLPAPCASSGSQPCYSAASTAAVSVPPLASVAVGAVSGYAEQVAATADPTNPVFGRASDAAPEVSVLPNISTLLPTLPAVGNPPVSSGPVQAKANCPNDGAVGAIKPVTAPSVSESVTGVSLLGGKVTFGVTDGQIVNLVVDGVSYPTGVTSLGAVTVSGATVSGFGADVLVSIPISVDQILGGLGLADSVINDLDLLSPTSTLALRLVVGPNATVTKTSATAWGLGIGADLSGTLSFNLADVVTANVNVPTGIAGNNLGNIVDVRLAYVTCQSGVNLDSGGSGSSAAIPPELV